jgi:hypothetical protein
MKPPASTRALLIKSDASLYSGGPGYLLPGSSRRGTTGSEGLPYHRALPVPSRSFETKPGQQVVRATQYRKRSHLIGCLLAIMLIALPFLRADDIDDAPPAPTAPPVTDVALVNQHLKEITARPQFRDTSESTVNSRIEDWLSQWFRNLGAKFGEFKYASRMPAFESLLMTLLVVFAISVLLYIMVRLTRRRGRMESEREDEVDGQKTFRAPEAYEREIQVALLAGDWHAAYLAGWRQFLSRLEYGNLVDADRTRTNREYLAQLRGRPMPATALGLLNALVDAYDRSIYGRQSIAEPDWTHFRGQLDEAALLLHLEDKVKSAPATGSAP